MPVEAKRRSALEVKPATRKTLEVYATSVRCEWTGLAAGSNVEVLEVDRLLMEFMNLQFSEGRRAWKGEKLLASGPLFSFEPFRSWTGIDLPGASGLSTAGNVQSRWYSRAGAYLDHVSGTSPARRNAVAQTFELPRTDGGWRLELGENFLPSDRDYEEQNWRSGRHDQSQLKSMFCGWNRCSRVCSARSRRTSHCSA